MMRLIYYVRLWLRLAGLSFSTIASNRVDALSYLIGKLVRFFFFWILIMAIFEHTAVMAGYDREEVFLFFLTFNVIDVAAQVFFRGVYIFRSDVVKGNFDFLLIRPVRSLFLVMSRMIDFLDIVFLIPIVGLLVWTLGNMEAFAHPLWLLSYVAFLILGMLIVSGFHILTAAAVITTLESDNIIWFYRDSMTIGRFPPEIFSGVIQLIFTFMMPIIVIVSYPAKALLGMLTWREVGITGLMLVFFLGGSLWLWSRALRHYSSAN